MKTIEISPLEANLIQQGLMALQREMNDSSVLPMLNDAEWAQRFETMCALNQVHALTLKVSSPFIAFTSSVK